jgi:hypothetical protein
MQPTPGQLAYEAYVHGSIAYVMGGTLVQQKWQVAANAVCVAAKLPLPSRGWQAMEHAYTRAIGDPNKAPDTPGPWDGLRIETQTAWEAAAQAVLA